jgi:hypothetical protein
MCFFFNETIIYFKLSNHSAILIISCRQSCSELQKAEYDAVWVAASTIVAAIKLLPSKLLSEERVAEVQTVVLKELAEDMCGTRSEHELRVFAWVLYVKFSNLDLHKL